MAIDWNTKGDFADVVDTLEPVTLLRRGSSEEIAIASAWRFSQATSEDQTDVEWQFEWDSATPAPRLGDRLLDAAGDCWTLLTVKLLQGATRWRCQSRNLRLAHCLDSLLTVEQAVWEDLGSGPEITSWTLFRPAVHARVQLEAVSVDESIDPITSTATYRITIEESLSLDHNHRFVAGDGTIYRLLRYENADRIDALPVATVRRE